MKTAEEKARHAAYMRGYWQRNPDKYAAMLERQKRNKTSTKTYRRHKDEPEFKGKKAMADKSYYERHKERIRDREGGRAYGISAAEYARLVSQPCAICGELEPRGKRGCGMHVDHDHETGEIRGTLCHRCNRGIGSFYDDPERLAQAATYCSKFKKEKAA